MGAIIADICIVGAFVMAVIAMSYTLNTRATLGPVLLILLLPMECILFGFVFGGSLRPKVFN